MIKRGKIHFSNDKNVKKPPFYHKKGEKPPFYQKKGEIPPFLHQKLNNTHIFQYYLHKKVSGYINGGQKVQNIKKNP